jgi:methionyl-tRNA formyltransferase
MQAAPHGATLLVVGADKISSALLGKLDRRPDLVVATDESMSLRRVARLMRSGALRWSDLARMFWCELRRPAVQASKADAAVRSNDDLSDLIRREGVENVVLFRAGLIVNRKVLALPVSIFNIHCASIATHGGLASIRRALEDGTLAQAATLHRVTERIDEGEMLAEEPFRLDNARSYCWNENTAYEAGTRLALRVLGSPNALRQILDGNATLKS